MPDKLSRLKDKLPSQLISWLGILGGAMTILSNLEGVLTLSKWARLLVSNWSDWMTSAWSWFVALMGVDAPSDFVFAWWTLSLFLLAAAFGARLTGGKAGGIRHVFRLSLTRLDVELFVLVFVLLVMLAFPSRSEEPDTLEYLVLAAPPYIASLGLSLVISDAEHLVKRLRLVVGIILTALALNWVSTVFVPLPGQVLESG